MSKSKTGTVCGRKWSKEPNFVMWCNGGPDHSTCGRFDLPSDFEEAQRGEREGKAWAAEGRSYAAVEAVYNLYFREDPEGEDAANAHYDALEAAMIEAIGEDDEEFFADDGPHNKMGMGEEGAPYVQCWLSAVSEYFWKEMEQAA
jgi:hypothetical protein